MKTQLISAGLSKNLFPLTEMLQHYGHTGRTGSFTINHGQEQAKIYLMTGILAHAEAPSFSGEDALVEILTWNNPNYEWVDFDAPQRTTMSSGVQDFLLHFIQLQASGELETRRKQAPNASKPEMANSEMFSYEMSLEISSTEMRAFTYLITTPQLRLGRHVDNDLVLPDSSISRRHAILIVSNDSILVRDLGSMNGININGLPQTQGLLHHGDLLRIGEVNLNVNISSVPKSGVAIAA